MINVGLYYRVKEGHESEFEGIFRQALAMLQNSNEGFIAGKLYKEVGEKGEYLIYTEWKDMDSFKKFISSRPFSDVQNYGKSILDGKPRHRVFKEENS
ncbi:MAG: antibiotic biosynthesis monooxygenase [Conexivisphaerales archaeon]